MAEEAATDTRLQGRDLLCISTDSDHPRNILIK